MRHAVLIRYVSLVSAVILYCASPARAEGQTAPKQTPPKQADATQAESKHVAPVHLVPKQNVPKRTPEELEALWNKHKGDFDYLLGDWEFTSVSKEYGKGRGYWSAVRLGDGADILDEYRVVGDNGDTYYVSATVRSYNAALDRWELISADKGRGLHDFGTARKSGDEMHIAQTFGVMSGKPALWRIRYYNIKPDSFSWTADRSFDDGKTWEKEHLTIETRRIGAARKLPPLAPARNAPGHKTGG
jgi:hypothetical protein